MLETPVESLDPQQATDGTSFEVIADYTDGLMQMDADGQAVPAIAESYDLSDDGLTYTFHLRSDAKWSNGTPVTAADFVFAWQRAVDPAVASEYAYMLSDIGQVKNAAEIIAGEKDKSELGVTAVDDVTLQVELNVPVSYFLSLMYFRPSIRSTRNSSIPAEIHLLQALRQRFPMVHLCLIPMSRQQLHSILQKMQTIMMRPKYSFPA